MAASSPQLGRDPDETTFVTLLARIRPSVAPSGGLRLLLVVGGEVDQIRRLQEAVRGGLPACPVELVGQPALALSRAEAEPNAIVITFGDLLGRTVLQWLEESNAIVPVIWIAPGKNAAARSRAEELGADVCLFFDHLSPAVLECAMHAAHKISRLRMKLQAASRAHEAMACNLTTFRDQDALTELATREAFLERVQRTLDRYQATGAGAPAVVYFELMDHDTLVELLGERKTELCIAALAERLEETVRPGDILARYSEHDFAALIDRDGVETAADMVARRLRRSLEEPLDLHGESIHVKVRCGAKVAEPDHQWAEELVRDARARRD